jgi:hypothetical protein
MPRRCQPAQLGAAVARRGASDRGEHRQAAKRAAVDIERHSEAAKFGQPGRLSASLNVRASEIGGGLGNVEAFERRCAKLGRVAHASLCGLDDPPGDSFIDRVVCVGNSQKLQCRFISCGETFYSFRVERVLLQ